MFDGLGIPVGTICPLLDLGIQASRVIGCVYGRVAHTSSGDMLPKRTVENPKNRAPARLKIDNIEMVQLDVGAVGLKRYTVTGALICGRVTLADYKYV
jgi:hypothetical protein